MSLPLPPSFLCGSPSWELLPTYMNEPRGFFVIVSDASSPPLKRKKLIVMGGETPNPSRHLSSCESFDVQAEAWEQLPSMPNPRSKFAAVWHGNTLFAIGGIGPDHETLRSVVCLHDGPCFSSRNNSWQDLPSMETRRSDFSAALVDNKIVVVGGLDEQGVALQTAEEFDVDTQTWTPLPDMSEPRASHLMAAVKEKVYVFGGCRRRFDLFDTAECYNTVTRRWGSLPHMPNPRLGGAAVAVGQHILLIGGISGVLASVDCFDTVSCQWLVFGAFPSPTIRRMFCGPALVGNHVFAVGGSGKKTMEKIEINPYYIMLPILLPLLKQEEDLPLGLWPHILASSSAASVVNFVLRSDKFLLASVMLHSK